MRSFLSGLLLVAGLCMLAPDCHAADGHKASDDVSFPENMETIQEGDVGILAPKGGRLRSEGSYLVKEDPEDYASRKFTAAEERFARIEEEIAALKEDIKRLKEDRTGGETAGRKS